MSLALRLNLGLLTIALLMLLGAGWFLIGDARVTVAKETQSALELATGLAEVTAAHLAHEHATEPVTENARSAISKISQLVHSTESRHVRLMLVPAGDTPPAESTRTPMTPAWFVQLVAPGSETLVRTIELPGTGRRVVLQADPADEIEEAWREMRDTLVMLSLLAGVFGAVVFWVGRLALRPLATIADSLIEIDEGRYRLQVRGIGIPEIDAITTRLNNLARERARHELEKDDLSRRALGIREEERRRLALELHDEMGQSISAIKALAVSISQRANVDERIQQNANTIAEVSTHIYGKARQLMAQLRPTALDELGLANALEEMIDDWNTRHDPMFCTFTVSGAVSGLGKTFDITLFRIVQEALTNVAKHSHANSASVTLTQRADATGGTLHLLIKDDGVGFDLSNTRRGLGLVGISERVAALHGKLALVTKPGAGTEFSIEFKLQGINTGDG
jgi:two-component system, NarL family, sensor histidine kinase UhpB